MLFKDENDYDKIMDLIIEKEYCYHDTHKWCDKKRGYKQTIAGMIYQLHFKGYFEDPITATIIESIAKSEFNEDLSLRIIKYSAKKDFKQEFSFIPAKK